MCLKYNWSHCLWCVNNNPSAAVSAAVSARLPLEPKIFATGDDNGGVALWDIRQQAAVVKFNPQNDYVADMCIDGPGGRLLAGSGDGTLAVFSLRQRKLLGKSEFVGDEILSLQVMKHGKKIVGGCQSGIINIWDADDWGSISDCFPGHPESVQTLVKIDEDTMLSGSSDDLIRVMNVHPNKIVGVLGEHEGDFPVKCVAMSRQRDFVASISHDATIKFWDLTCDEVYFDHVASAQHTE